MQKRNETLMPLPNSRPEPDRALLALVPMVRILALQIHRGLPRHVEIDDLVSAGLVGLIEAYARFDPDRNPSLSAYVSFRIKGAILDSLRNSDWAPRDLRRKGRAAHEAIRTLTLQLGCGPSEEQVAAELKTSLVAYQKLRGDLDGTIIGTLRVWNGGAFDEEERLYPSARPDDDPLFCCMRGETSKRLTGAMKNLPRNERLVMTLHYYQELTCGEIGLATGRSERRVCQICNSAVIHLRAALSDIALRGDRDLLHLASNVTIPRGRALLTGLAP